MLESQLMLLMKSSLENQGGGNFKTFNNFLIAASKEFPGKIATHIIVGLGESDEDIVDILLKMKKHGIIVGLFAFTPIKGTKLETYPRPTLERYRKCNTSIILLNTMKSKRNLHFRFKRKCLTIPGF